ncbi:hypothetical protein ACVR0T_08700, partial [Streptococcus chenjunshii]
GEEGIFSTFSTIFISSKSFQNNVFNIHQRIKEDSWNSFGGCLAGNKKKLCFIGPRSILFLIA